MNLVGQPFQAAGATGFPARRSFWGLEVPSTGRLESLPYGGRFMGSLHVLQNARWDHDPVGAGRRAGVLARLACPKTPPLSAPRKVGRPKRTGCPRSGSWRSSATSFRDFATLFRHFATCFSLSATFFWHATTFYKRHSGQSHILTHLATQGMGVALPRAQLCA